jgi:hypothetical protein
MLRINLIRYYLVIETHSRVSPPKDLSMLFTKNISASMLLLSLFVGTSATAQADDTEHFTACGVISSAVGVSGGRFGFTLNNEGIKTDVDVWLDNNSNTPVALQMALTAYATNSKLCVLGQYGNTHDKSYLRVKEAVSMSISR